MLLFGIDVPLLEIIFVMGIVIFLLLVESIVIIAMLSKQMSKTKKLGELVEKLSGTLLEIKKAEIDELDKLRGRK